MRERLRERDPEADRKVAAFTSEMERELTLAELRRALRFTQQQIAASLDTNQSRVSRIEHQADLFLSTLRSYIEAMGGSLELRGHPARGWKGLFSSPIVIMPGPGPAPPSVTTKSASRMLEGRLKANSTGTLRPGNQTVNCPQPKRLCQAINGVLVLAGDQVTVRPESGTSSAPPIG